MNNALRAVLLFLMNKRYIGGRHTPEDKLIKSKTRWLDREEVKNFKKEYKQMINKGFIFKAKKMTKKGTDWHICLNPRKLKELNSMLK